MFPMESKGIILKQFLCGKTKKKKSEQLVQKEDSHG